MKKSTLALAIALAAIAQQAAAAGFIEDSKASVSSRTLYFDNDQRDGGADQRETATGPVIGRYSPGWWAGPSPKQQLLRSK